MKKKMWRSMVCRIRKPACAGNDCAKVLGRYCRKKIYKEELYMKRFRQRYGIALTKKKLQEIILMLMALEAVFAFSYLGYIELPAISTTTLHILVIVAAMMLGA